jgi:hypothetical protein
MLPYRERMVGYSPGYNRVCRTAYDSTLLPHNITRKQGCQAFFHGKSIYFLPFSCPANTQLLSQDFINSNLFCAIALPRQKKRLTNVFRRGTMKTQKFTSTKEITPNGKI